MSDKHISDKRQRHSKRYQLLHAQLRAEVKQSHEPEPSKSDRKRMASEAFRATGER